MTFHPAPPVERRTGAEIRAEIYERLQAERRRQGAGSIDESGSVEALAQVFARYWEVVSTRLNAALDKHFLAYLDHLGVEPVPATSARVPLTFSPVTMVPRGVVVPARTQVAAPAAEGETEPVVFETTAPLELTAAALRHVFALDPARNLQHPMPQVANAAAPMLVPVFGGGEPADHTVFIGDGLVFGLKDVTTVAVRFECDGGPPTSEATRILEWSIPTDQEPLPLVPTVDGTRALRHSGEVVFNRVDVWPVADLFGRSTRWLSARLTGTGAGNWSMSARRIELRAEVTRDASPMEIAISDGGPVDLSKDFYPFGMQPRFGSTLYLAHADALSRPGTRVTLNVRLTNPYDAADEPPIHRVNHEGHPRVGWEYWNGTQWTTLDPVDSTLAFRTHGTVTFQVPTDFAAADVQGQRAHWVRARLTSGHYGEVARVEADATQPGGVRFREGTLSPPSIQSVTASYRLAIARRPDFVVTSNERVYQDRSEAARAGLPFPLFGFPCGGRSALYLAFQPRPQAPFAGDSLALYVIAQRAGTPFSRQGSGPVASQLRWQSWNGDGWRDMQVRDETDGLTSEGRVSFRVPEGARPRQDLVERTPLFWFRLLEDGEAGGWQPALRAIALNTVVAEHKTTRENEVLGSSHGDPDQRFKVLRAPILEGEVVQVIEPIAAPELAHRRRTGELPPEHLIEIDEEGRAGAIPGAVWVQWQRVDTLAASGPHDRHYVLDRRAGEVTFGDGQHGRIPPTGMNNVRLRRYETGGGTRGNTPALTITQLRSAVPYVDAVTNLVPATGGADAEPIDRVKRRGATSVRHRGRAVTVEDYEDLALLASPQVARACCVPLRDLTRPPAVRPPQPGMVSVIVIPKSAASLPVPEGDLLRRVGAYLDRYRNAASELVIVGPEYVRVNVEASLVVSDERDATAIAALVGAAIDEYLHPLIGGPAREGWRLGERAERRDLYAICASTPGVLYCSRLVLSETEQRQGIIAAGHFFVAAGEHRLSVHHAVEGQGAPASMDGAAHAD